MNLQRWVTFSRSQQLLFIGTEFVRGSVWQHTDREKFHLALERALELVDLTLSDQKWKLYTRVLLGLREEISKFYIGQRDDDLKNLYYAL